jgi:hypothetical protein
MNIICERVVELLEEFTKAYDDEDSEALRAFWKEIASTLDLSRQEVVDSLLDDLSDGGRVVPFLETIPDDYDEIVNEHHG